MTDPKRRQQPYLHASAWKGSELKDKRDWILELSSADNDELAAALVAAKKRGKRIPELAAADFPLPTLSAKLKTMCDEVIDGRGFKLVRGFEINRFAIEDAALIYWGLGSYMGVGHAQNAQGDMLGHVTDLGLSMANPNARGYQTNLKLPFHNDSLDIVGLMCVHPARSGGLSRIVSSTAIHNIILERRPDLMDAMYFDYCVDRRGEAPAGKLPYYIGPFFEWHRDRLFCRYNRTYIESAQRFPEVARLTPQQIAAMDLIDSLCNDPEMYLDMALEPGDMQFICNYTTLHSRTNYVDWPEKEKRRYLLRLWLDTGRLAPLPQSYIDRFDDMKIWQQNPRPPIFDLSLRRSELAH